MAIRPGLPAWMKWTLGLGGLLIAAVLGMMVLGHNPMQHLMAHAG